MIDFLTDIPFVSLFLKFMIASTVLLGSVWLLEKTKLLNTPDLAELAWKLAIAGSFIAILPISELTSSTVTIESDRTAALIEDLNERRPFSEENAQQAPATVNLNDAVTRNESTRTILNTTVESDSNNGFKPQPLQVGDMKLDLGNLEQKQNAELELSTPEENNNTAANTSNAQVLEPEYDSEGTNDKSIWYQAADLRAKDVAMLGWVGLALIAIIALLFSYHGAVRNLGSRVRVQSEDRANKILRAVCEKADIRHVPYLSRSGDIKSPVCLPRKEICLPDWAFDDMPEAEFKSLLAHELGHMVRRDPIMLMFLQLLSRIFFFQPLFIIARKRLTDIAELAADEWAAGQAENSRAVANALFTCATKIHETRQIQWGLAMAGNKSILKQRVERLIDAQSVPFKTAGTFTKSIMGVGVIGLSLGLPSIEFAGAMTAESEMMAEAEMGGEYRKHPHDVEVTPMPKVAPMPRVSRLARVAPVPSPAPTPSVSVSTRVAPTAAAVASATATASAAAHPRGNFHIIDRDGHSGSMSWHNNGEEVSVSWEGEFRLNDAEDFFISDDDDGFLRLKTEIDDEKRSIKFEAEGGDLTYTYRHEGDKKELDADGRKWLKTAIKMLIETGFNAEDRVERLYDKGKTKAVFKEIDRFEGDHVRRIYLSHLIELAKLSDKDVSRAVDIAAKFDSDFEQRLTLSMLLSEEKVSDKMLPKVLKIAKGFDSDFEKRLLVSHYVSEMKLTDKTTTAVIDIAETIDSDFELRLLIGAAMDNAKLSDKNVVRILDMAIKKIDSDFEKRLMLSSLSDEFDRSDLVVSKVLDATATIDSDFERRLLLATLIDQADLNEKNWLKAISVAEDIDSRFEQSQVFAQIRDKMPKNNKKVKAAFEKASAGLKEELADSRFTIDIQTGISEGINEAMEELAEELRELEEEQAEMAAEMAEAFTSEDWSDRREAQRMMREKHREMSEVLRDQSRVEREVERATHYAMREIERELSRVQRDLSRASGGLKHELTAALRGLERSRDQLQRDIERNRVEIEERRKERLDRQKAKEKAKEKDDGETSL
jgi:beta-lactamase regulating signal transducer with metallopeptidase domain